MKYSALFVTVAFVLQLHGAIPEDSIGEGTCIGFVPIAADTVKDTAFHEGDTLTLEDGSKIIKPHPSERTEAVIPSVKTDVKIIAGDGFAHGRVEQVFANPFDLPFEATYIFPLPHDGAVHAMEFRTSYGVFHASLLEKEEAEQQYEQAKQQGLQASLLTQTQDNIFVQKLCNIPPNDSVKVTITFSMALTYSSGTYELAFPTVVGPRYTPASSAGSFSNPTYLPPETRSGNTLDFTIAVITPYEVKNVICASHDAALEGGDLATALSMLQMMGVENQLPPETNPTLIRMAARETIPNKDIVVRFERKNSDLDVSMLSWHDGDEGYFAMNIFPDRLDTASVTDSKAIDMIFVLDISGSMSGTPLNKMKEIMYSMMAKARPVDRLSFMAFNTSVNNCFSEPVEATAENLAKAREWIEGLDANGGTEMLQGVKSGLAVPIDTENRIRIISLFTDGFISNIDQIYTAFKNDPNGTIPFTFGIGSSVNRELIDGAAKAGNGIAKVVLPGDPVEPLIDEFWSRIRSPQLTDITIDWGGSVNGLIPETVNNLWLGQPVTILGRYNNGGTRSITLTGKKDGVAVSETYDVFFVMNNTFVNFIPKIWARQKIESLYNEQVSNGNEHNKDSILSVSLDYEVLCKYTAFLAVADSVVNKDGEMISAEIAVSVPEYVDPYMSGAISVNTSLQQAYGFGGNGRVINDDAIDVKKENPVAKKSSSLVINSKNGLLKMVLSGITAQSPVFIDVFDIRGRKVGSWRLTSKSANLIWSWNYRKCNICAGLYTFVIRINKKLTRSVVLR